MSSEQDDEDTPLKRQQRLEQSSAMIAENMPPFWRRLYLNCKSEGFTEQQAMSILRTYIRALFAGAK